MDLDLIERISRRTFLKSLAGLSSLALGGLGYTIRIEPFWPAVQRVRVPIARYQATTPLTIGHLSDFHSGRAFGRGDIQTCVDMLNAQSPDVIVLTGDFVDRYSRIVDYVEIAAEALSSLRAPLGVYAVLGNHDYWTDARGVKAQLADAGITVLVNERRRLVLNEQPFWLLGADCAWEGKPDLDALLDGIPGTEPTILLVHEPDFVDHAAPRGIDLQLSGHSHGGQVRFPLLGTPFLPYLARKYPKGLYHVTKTWLYTTRGVGVSSSIPFRFNCRPEVTLVTVAAPPG